MKTNKILIFKTLGYRLSTFCLTSLVAYLFTDDFKSSLAIGLADTIFKLFYYHIYDLIWEKIRFKTFKPKVIWLTGLSGAGKTTIAYEMKSILTKWGNKVVVLDGDEIREMFPQTGFDMDSRLAHNKRVAFMSDLLYKQGAIVLVSLISPYRKGRDDARKMIGDDFIEVYVSTDLDLCKKRDVKGLYAKVEKGEIKNFTGIDAPYEEPTKAEIIIDTKEDNVLESAKKIIKKLKEYDF